MDNIQIGYIVVLVLGVTYAIKKAGINSRYLPLIALLLGVGTTYLFSGNVSFLATVSGVILGLSSSGLYDFGKKTVLGK